eukprot:g17884.t1
MGLATLICELEQPCLHVSHAARGSRISGMVVQPGVKFSGEVLVHVAAPQDEDEDKDKEFPQFPIDSEQVLGIPVDQLWRWGLGDGRDFLPPKGSPEPEYHIFFHDLFARAGGDTNSDVVSVKVSEAFLRVSGHHVVLDNVWLWRANHDKAHAVIRRSVDGPPYYKNNVKNGLQKQGLLNGIFGGFADGGKDKIIPLVYEKHVPAGVHPPIGLGKGYQVVGGKFHDMGRQFSRKDTKIHKVQAFDNNQGTATCNFWRLAEGFHTPQNLDWYTSQACALRRVKTNGNLNLAGRGSSSGGFVGDADVGTAGGGGIVNFSTQQQFCLRNVRCWNNGLKGHAANPSGFGQFVYISSPTVRAGGDFKNTVIPKTPIIAEKPYLVAMKKNGSKAKEPKNKAGSFSFLEKRKWKKLKVFKDDRKSKTLSEHLYYIVVPPAKYNSVSGWDPLPPLKWFGTTKEETAEVKKGKKRYGRVIDFTRVHVAAPPDIGTEINAVVDEINAVLSSTEPHVVLTPGIYRLTQPIVVRSVNAVLYGLGLATLICELTAPCLRVSHAARGSPIGGLLIEPGLKFAGDVLVDVDEPQSTDEDKDKKFPGFPIDGTPPKGSPEPEYYMFFHDFFVRAGGDTNSDLIGPHVSVKEAMLRIKGHHVVLDNVWLWRADHDLNGKFPLHMYTKPPYYTNRVKNGLQVFGDHVSFYMLAVEHIIGDHVLWKGNFGRTYFYQCEFPYDLGPTSYAMNRFVSYHVVPSDASRSGKKKVFQHDCRGLAVYSMFMDSDAAPAAAIQVPDVGTTKSGQNWIRVEHANTHQICCGGGIASVINGRGGGVGTKGGSDAFQSLIVTPGHTRYER